MLVSILYKSIQKPQMSEKKRKLPICRPISFLCPSLPPTFVPN